MKIKFDSTKDSHLASSMALCNLGSLNALAYWQASPEQRKFLAYQIVKAIDNALDTGECPMPDGTASNALYRYIGIGLMNYAQLLADSQIVIDTQEALEFTAELFDNISYDLYEASWKLAQEKGPAPEFKNSKWAQGTTPIHLSIQHNPKAWEFTEYQRNFISSGKIDRWNQLASNIARDGIRNLTVMAIAPTMTSAVATNSTEGCEPVFGLQFKHESANKNVPSLAPNVLKNAKYYKTAFECDQKMLIDLAIIRQCFIDQAQSITIYLKNPRSVKELTDLHMHAFNHGIKTLYYSKQLKTDVTKDDCEACAA